MQKLTTKMTCAEDYVLTKLYNSSLPFINFHVVLFILFAIAM
jgi:hypothetical protein